MDNRPQINSEPHQKNNDEIDIAELLMKIWRKKWFISAVVIFITSTTLIYLGLTPSPPNTYTVKSSLRIGNVGSYTIQSPEEIVNSVKKELYNEVNHRRYIINDTSPSKKPNSDINTVDYEINTIGYEATVWDRKWKFKYKLIFTAMKKSIDFSIQTSSPKESFNRAKMIGDYIIKYHTQIYTNAIKLVQDELFTIRRMNVFIGKDYMKMKLLYENERHPTDYIIEPSTPLGPDTNPGKKILLKTSIAIITSLFFGIFISLFYDYVSVIRKKIIEKSEDGKKNC